MKKITEIIKYITRNPFLEDKEKLVAEIAGDEEQKAIFRKLKIAWALFSTTKQMSDYDIENSYRKLQNIIKKDEVKKSGFSIGPILKYAAIFITLFAIPLFYYLGKQSTESITVQHLKYASIVVDEGQTSKIILPDSSVVWLNSGTTLSYNNGYSIDNRDLILEGQAYFNVTRNENIPLTVACGDIKVKVLGTKFDVNAYPGNNEINVVLESGEVELFHSEIETFSLKMKPGERTAYNVMSKKFKIDKINTENFTNWKEGYLIFSDTPMKEVIQKLERKFNVDIVVKNESVYESLFNARFKDEELSEILEYIEYSCSIKYKMIKNEELNKSIIEFY